MTRKKAKGRENQRQDLLGAQSSPGSQRALKYTKGTCQKQGSSRWDCAGVGNGLCNLAYPVQVWGVPLLHRQCNHLSHFVRVHRTVKTWGDHSKIYLKEPTPSDCPAGATPHPHCYPCQSSHRTKSVKAGTKELWVLII